MAFRSFLKSAARSAAKALGFGVQVQTLTPRFDEETRIRLSQEELACAICTTPRKLYRYEAQALMMLAENGGKSRAIARAALYNAAFFSGRHTGPKPTVEPRLRKASTARLAFWATDRSTPV